MATVVEMMESARAFFPNFVTRLKSTSLDELETTSSTPQQMRPTLSLVIDEIVLPRLIDAHREATPDETVVDVDQLAQLALHRDAAALFERVDVLLERGFAIDAILVDVLAPVARRLGKMWEDDDCDFVDVTLALWRLQEVVRDLSARTVPLRTETEYTALFVPFPGEQHSLGTVMVEDVFRRNGWDTTLLLDAERAEIIDAVARRSYDLVGLTVSCDDHRGSIAALVSALRAVSRNPRLCIMLGGRVPAAEPDLITKVGADCTAPDAQQAVAVAARLVAANACREVFTA